MWPIVCFCFGDVASFGICVLVYLVTILGFVTLLQPKMKQEVGCCCGDHLKWQFYLPADSLYAPDDSVHWCISRQIADRHWIDLATAP
jgi:hypothetical protein